MSSQPTAQPEPSARRREQRRPEDRPADRRRRADDPAVVHRLLPCHDPPPVRGPDGGGAPYAAPAVDHDAGGDARAPRVRRGRLVQRAAGRQRAGPALGHGGLGGRLRLGLAQRPRRHPGAAHRLFDDAVAASERILDEVLGETPPPGAGVLDRPTVRPGRRGQIPCAGSWCTWWRSTPGTRGTPTCCARPWTARRTYSRAAQTAQSRSTRTRRPRAHPEPEKPPTGRC